MELTGFIERAWSVFSPWLGSTITVVATAVIVLVTRFVLERAGADRRGVPYQRQIAATVIVIVGVFVTVVFMPIEPDVRGQILSLLGVLLSAVVAFSSTSLVGNAMAGIMMRLSRSYRPGDFIQVEDIVGRVTDQGLFHTDVQLITRDMVALPNLYLSRHPVHVTRASGTFVAVDVSLGYELPQVRVEEALAEAVTAVDLTEPFVLVDALLDHAVRYRVFGLLEDTSQLLSARSRLRRSVMSTLHARGMQIVSPGFVNRVEFSPEHQFVPRSAREPDEAETAAQPQEQVEAIAFDKAEEAESIERLYKLQEKLQHEQETLAERLKESEDKEEKERLRAEQEQVQSRIERTGEIIQERESEREEHDLEE